MTRKRFSTWLSLFALLSLLAGCGAAAGHAEASRSGGAYGGAPMAPGDSVQGAEEQAEMDGPPAPPEPSPAMEVSASSDKAGAAPPAPAAPPVMKPAPAKMRDELEVGDRRPTTEKKSAPATGGERTPATGGERTPATGGQNVVASQMLVYTADLQIRVQEVSKAIDAVEKLAKARGGYLVLREDNRITVRVPSAKFDAALDELLGLGDLVHRNVSIEDVTDLYFDMQVRMKNLEIVKNRLEELLKKAATVDESLAVQRQLERVTGELERMRGKLKLLAELVMFSTITVVFESKATEHLESNVRLPFPWMDHLGLGELLSL